MKKENIKLIGEIDKNISLLRLTKNIFDGITTEKKEKNENILVNLNYTFRYIDFDLLHKLNINLNQYEIYDEIKKCIIKYNYDEDNCWKNFTAIRRKLINVINSLYDEKEKILEK